MEELRPGWMYCFICTGDETLRFWNVSGTPAMEKPALRASPEPFTHLNHSIQ
ncbi:hypothetical protein DCAR_0104528 [Daucus carota subsp. sativus]|uniref:Uncharacterized protein n=1 Tax=Daucus carota subsp. sativus TaxID=79200 RepID=A0AAF0W8N8_DAUCS|nr:hypothetical protein DCAR_0104528 [Daucus carota subsp. sativus]